MLRPDTANATIAALRDGLARNAAPDRRDRVELAGIDFHWPNASMTHGLDNTLGYNPLRLGDYSRATGAGDHVALPDQRQFSALFPATARCSPTCSAFATSRAACPWSSWTAR